MIPVLDDAIVEAAAKTLGDAVTGGEINDILMSIHVIDTTDLSTKWRRIHRTFADRQRADRCANKFGDFIERVSAPARWSGKRDEYASFRERLNETLHLGGLRLAENGKLVMVPAASTLDESAERANRLRAVLQQRAVHSEVLRACSKLVLKDKNYFHAVFEVTKGLMDRLRQMTGSTADGNALIDETLECGKRPYPIVALNRYDTPSLQNEQKGITHLARGLVHAFRNVTSHEPAVTWMISEADALDMMGIASLIHRRLDTAAVTATLQSATS